jgi:hypothetical protein
MKTAHLLVASSIILFPLIASAQMTPETAPVTQGSGKTLEKVWGPGIRWIVQKPGVLERLDGTTLTVKKQGEEYVIYEDDKRLQGSPSLALARVYAEKRARHLVNLNVLPRTVVDQNAEEDAGSIKGVSPKGAE